MAEADPKRLPNEEADDRPNKRTKITGSTAAAAATATGGFPQWKDPNEIADTTTSKLPKKEEIEEVDYNTIEIMEEILSYRNQKGVYPCESPDDFRKFCFPYIQMGIGNAGGWVKKMEEMKNKFNNQSAPMEDVEKKEFELWKKIWGNGQDQPNETEDTASSKQKKEEVIEVAENDINNVLIMQEILSYRDRKGVCPSKSKEDFQSFCHLYIHLGVGNAQGWANKMNEMKNKFNRESAPMDDVEKQEFELWKKIWGNDQDQPKGGDNDPGVGSSK